MTVVLGYRDFAPRAPWLGADLQTLRNLLRGQMPALPTGETLRVTAADETGDILIGTYHRGHKPSTPLIVLCHGLSGCQDSAYMGLTTHHFVDLGYDVIRFNHRGAGPSARFCQRYYHAGKSEDLRTFLESISKQLTRRGVIVVGFSLGGNIALKLLGESGLPKSVIGGVSVSAPIDLAGSSRQMLRIRNTVYTQYLLRDLKRQTLMREGLTESQRLAVQSSKNIYEFDDRFVAPVNGFGDADSYYLQCSARGFLSSIKLPTLLVHAMDDPWIPGESYTSVDWGALPSLTPLLPASGGHLGFHGRGDKSPWYNGCIERFIGALAL